MFCEGRVLDLKGNGIPNCSIETWETYSLVSLSSGEVVHIADWACVLYRDDDGLYDTQYEGRTEPDCRGRLTTDENGYYSVSARSIYPCAQTPSDRSTTCFNHVECKPRSEETTKLDLKRRLPNATDSVLLPYSSIARFSQHLIPFLTVSQIFLFPRNESNLTSCHCFRWTRR